MNQQLSRVERESGLRPPSVFSEYQTDLHSPPRGANLIVRYAGDLWGGNANDPGPCPYVGVALAPPTRATRHCGGRCIAAVPAPGHFGAANRFGPTVCLKCTAAHSTPAHRCFVVSLVVKTGGPCPTPPRGIGPSVPCCLMTARRFSLVGNFLRGSVRACHSLSPKRTEP